MSSRLISGFAGLLALSVASAAAMERAPLPEAQIQQALNGLVAQAKGAIADKSVPGIAIAVVHGDKVIFAEGFGVRDVGSNEPVDADTVFQLASISKAVGSTVVSGLIGDGNLTWDTKISDLTPGFALYDAWPTSEVTVRDFYAHRSGLPDHAGDLLEDIGYDREAVMHRLRYQPPLTSFRSGYAYTNFGITVAAVAAASTTGKSWEDVSAERLYAPLGMTSTSSRYDEFMARPNRASGHVMVDGKWTHTIQRQPDAQTPAGGVSSSANDMAKWVSLVMNDGMFGGKQVIASAPLIESHLPQMRIGTSLDGLPSYYGLGWNVGYNADGRHKISHSGAFAMGTGTNVTISLDDKLGIIVLTNAAPIGVAEGLAAEFIDNALYGKQTQPWFQIYRKALTDMMNAQISTAYDKAPSSPGPAAANDAYVGTYTNDFYGDVAVVAAGEGLALELGPNRKSFPLTHYDRDVFTFVTEGENASGLSGVSFALGADGKAVTVRIDAFDESHLGILRRVGADGG